jgi:hypothetical protein
MKMPQKTGYSLNHNNVEKEFSKQMEGQRKLHILVINIE